VKYANVLECKVPGRHCSDSTLLHLTERHFISKIQPSEKRARPQGWCVVCQKHEKRKETVYWCDACDTLCGMCSRVPRQGNKVLFHHNFHKFTVLKVILQCIGVDIPILYTSLNIISKLE
jgi:hypothetical protein